MPAGTALRFERASVRREAVVILDEITWSVEAGERWVVLGPNGSGKTTLVQLATGAIHPTSGAVHVLGHRLGAVDVRQLRTRIGLVSGSVTRLLRASLTAHDIVLTGRFAALEPWWHKYGDADHRRASALLASAGLERAEDRQFALLSEGERQLVLLARAMMGEPELLVFDEPAAGLDLGARERLIGRLEELANDPSAPPIVFVTHHVEEIPPSFGSVMLLRRGAVVASGAIAEVLDSAHLSQAFDVDVELHCIGDRFTARARP